MANYQFLGFANNEAEYQINLTLYGTFEAEIVGLIFEFLQSNTSSVVASKTYTVNEDISPA